VDDERDAVAHADGGAHPRTITLRGIEVEVVRHDDGVDPAIRELGRGERVDRHVPPRRVGGRPVPVPVLRALPREVVVMQDGGAALDGGRDRVGGGRVERERADVLHDHEVGGLERSLERGGVGR